MTQGLDSLAVTAFTSSLSEELGTSLSATILFDHPTIESIADSLAGEYLQVLPETAYIGAPVNQIVESCASLVLGT